MAIHQQKQAQAPLHGRIRARVIPRGWVKEEWGPSMTSWDAPKRKVKARPTSAPPARSPSRRRNRDWAYDTYSGRRVPKHQKDPLATSRHPRLQKLLGGNSMGGAYTERAPFVDKTYCPSFDPNDTWGKGRAHIPSFGRPKELPPRQPPTGPTRPQLPARMAHSVNRFHTHVQNARVLDGMAPLANLPAPEVQPGSQGQGQGQGSGGGGGEDGAAGRGGKEWGQRTVAQMTWPEYRNLSPPKGGKGRGGGGGDVIITIEHCHSCQRHQMTTKHVEGKYLDQASEAREVLLSALQGFPIRLAVLLKKADVCAAPSVGGGGQAGRKRARAVDPEGKRVGAFEVQLARRRGGVGQVDAYLLVSKLSSGHWPKLGSLGKRVQDCLSRLGLSSYPSGNRPWEEEGGSEPASASLYDSSTDMQWDFDHRPAAASAAQTDRNEAGGNEASGSPRGGNSASPEEEEALATARQEDELREWLFRQNASLARYTDTLREEGFDSLSALSLLTLEDIQVLPGMKRGHAKLLMAAVRQRKDEAGSGDGNKGNSSGGSSSRSSNSSSPGREEGAALSGEGGGGGGVERESTSPPRAPSVAASEEGEEEDKKEEEKGREEEHEQPEGDSGSCEGEAGRRVDGEEDKQGEGDDEDDDSLMMAEGLGDEDSVNEYVNDEYAIDHDSAVSEGASASVDDSAEGGGDSDRDAEAKAENNAPFGEEEHQRDEDTSVGEEPPEFDSEGQALIPPPLQAAPAADVGDDDAAGDGLGRDEGAPSTVNMDYTPTPVPTPLLGADTRLRHNASGFLKDDSQAEGREGRRRSSSTGKLDGEECVEYDEQGVEDGEDGHNGEEAEEVDEVDEGEEGEEGEESEEGKEAGEVEEGGVEDEYGLDFDGSEAEDDGYGTEHVSEAPLMEQQSVREDHVPELDELQGYPDDEDDHTTTDGQGETTSGREEHHQQQQQQQEPGDDGDGAGESASGNASEDADYDLDFDEDDAEDDEEDFGAEAIAEARANGTMKSFDVGSTPGGGFGGVGDEEALQQQQQQQQPPPRLTPRSYSTGGGSGAGMVSPIGEQAEEADEADGYADDFADEGSGGGASLPGAEGEGESHSNSNADAYDDDFDDDGQGEEGEGHSGKHDKLQNKLHDPFAQAQGGREEYRPTPSGASGSGPAGGRGARPGSGSGRANRPGSASSVRPGSASGSGSQKRRSQQQQQQ